MPAPLAKGLIIAAGVIFAAGIAVYESPQVQEWMEKTRRKIAIALQNLGDEINPPSPSDAEVEAAVLAARRKRDEIMATNREMFVKQQLRKRPAAQAASEQVPDDHRKDSYPMHNSSVEQKLSEGGMSRGMSHGNDTQAKELTAQIHPSPPPFLGADIVDKERSEWQEGRQTRGSSTTLENSPSAQHETSLPDPEPLIQVDTELRSEMSSPVVATPARTPSVPASPHYGSPREISSGYFPVNEWAEHTSPLSSGILPNTTQPDYLGVLSQSTSAVPSISGSIEDLGSDAGAVEERSEGRQFDILSDTSGIRTPGTWTEVGSEVSEGDIGQ